VTRLLADPAQRAARAAAAARVAGASGGVLDAVLRRFAPWLDALAPAGLEQMPAPPMRAHADARS
jgi:hypothetical protein